MFRQHVVYCPVCALSNPAILPGSTSILHDLDSSLPLPVLPYYPINFVQVWCVPVCVRSCSLVYVRIEIFSYPFVGSVIHLIAAAARCCGLRSSRRNAQRINLELSIARTEKLKLDPIAVHAKLPQAPGHLHHELLRPADKVLGG